MKKTMPFPPTLGTKIPGSPYTLSESIGDGGRGIAFIADDERRRSQHKKVVVKFPNIDLNTHGPAAVREHIKEVNDAYAREYEAWDKLKKVPNIAHLIDDVKVRLNLGIVSETFPFVIPVVEYIKGLSFGKWMEALANERGRNSSSGVDLKLWYSIAKQLLKTIESIHLHKIVHGDIWPNNLIMRAEGKLDKYVPVLIDFGSACPLEAVDTEPSQKEGSWLYRAPERLNRLSETTENAPVTPKWYAPVDLYAIGMILLNLAIGKRAEDKTEFKGTYDYKASNGADEPRILVFRDNEEIKDNIVTLLAKYNPEFLERGGGAIDLIMSCIRPKLSERYKTATDVLRQLEIYEPPTESSGIYLNELLIKQSSTLNSAIRKISKNCRSPVLMKLLYERLRDISVDVSSADSNLIASWRGRYNAISDLVSAMAVLSEGDHCIALITPTFWKKESVGPNGRVLTLLKQIALRGATVSWVIATTENPNDPEFAQILEYQKKAMIETCGELRKRSNQTGDVRKSYAGSYKVSLRVLTQKQYFDLIAARETFICLRSNGYDTLCIPDYSMAGGQLSVVRFWDDKLLSNYLLRRFSTYENSSIPVAEL